MVFGKNKAQSGAIIDIEKAANFVAAFCIPSYYIGYIGFGIGALFYATKNTLFKNSLVKGQKFLVQTFFFKRRKGLGQF